jgi:thiaminase/transcriptional activator TenA
MGFSKQLKEENIELWKAVLKQPFLKEIYSGDLHREKFIYYIKQDYLYLQEFSRCIGLAASKAVDIGSMGKWAEMMAGCLSYEVEMLENLSTKLGITVEEMRDAELSPTNRAYTNHILKVAYSGTFGENLAALLPCMWTYKDVGERALKQEQGKTETLYREWCLTYSSPDYANLVQAYINPIDKYASEAGPGQLKQMRKHFKQSLVYEYMFWDMAYRMEEWKIPSTNN